jgi:uncharacterized repeat protein (TIGR01451 family)
MGIGRLARWVGLAAAVMVLAPGTALAVAGPPGMATQFGALTIPVNGTTTLQFTISNPNLSTSLSGVGFMDSLPAALAVAPNPGVTNGCGGTVTAIAGAGTISLSPFLLAPQAHCMITVSITGSTPSIDTNSVSATSDNGGTGVTASSTITVVGPPIIIKAFGASSIPLGGSTSLTFTVENANATVALSGIAFTDALPSGMVVSTPPGIAGSCGGGTITASGGASTISLSGAVLPASTSCQFSVNVTGIAAGQWTNTTGRVTSTEGGTGGTATAFLTVLAPPGIAQSFSPTAVPVGGTSELTFTLTNPSANPNALTGVAFTDMLPVGLTVATSTSTACGGTLNASSPRTISLTGALLPAGQSCQLSIPVTGGAVGRFTNTTGHVSATNGGSGASAPAVLSVGAPTIQAAFGEPTIPVGGATTLSFQIGNPDVGITLSGVGFTDTLPAGLAIATPNGATNTCGGTLGATAAGTAIELSGATLAAEATCSLTVNVTGTAAGAKANATGAISSDQSGAGPTASSSVDVLGPPALTMSFGARAIPLDGTTTLTFTVTNPASNPLALSGIAFGDTLPSGLKVATPNRLTGACGGGTVSAPSGSPTVSLSGATLVPQTSCTFSVEVAGTTSGRKADTTDSITSTNGGTGGAASASITVVPKPPSSRIVGLHGTVRAASLKRFHGTAKAGSAPVRSVAISLERIANGAIVASGRRTPECWALDSHGRLDQVKPKGHKCPALRFIRAHGTTEWSFTLRRRLPAGSYVVTSRATDQSGQSETAFTGRSGNRVRFEVR